MAEPWLISSLFIDSASALNAKAMRFALRLFAWMNIAKTSLAGSPSLNISFWLSSSSRGTPFCFDSRTSSVARTKAFMACSAKSLRSSFAVLPNASSESLIPSDSCLCSSPLIALISANAGALTPSALMMFVISGSLTSFAHVVVGSDCR